MEQLKPPEGLQLGGNMAENWRRFIRRFDNFRLATDAAGKQSEPQQVAVLLHVAGEEAQEIYHQFEWTRIKGDNHLEDKQIYEDVVGKFQDYFSPRKNITYERYKFLTRHQKKGETIDEYVRDLRVLSETCEFKCTAPTCDVKDTLIRDKIVSGVQSPALIARLLRQLDLTLEGAIGLCRAAEMSSKQVKDLTGAGAEPETDAVDAVTREKNSGWKRKSGNTSKKDNRSRGDKVKLCKFCGNDCAPRKCPAYGATCARCGKKHHFASMCKTQDVHLVECDDDEHSDDSDDDDEPFFLEAIECGDYSDEDEPFYIETIESSSDRPKWTLAIASNNVKFDVKIDTGAQCNVLPKSLCDKLKVGAIEKSKARLVSYTGHKLNTIGKVTITASVRNKYHPITFQVVDAPVMAVMGLPTCLELQLVKKMFAVSSECDSERPEDILSEFAHVFEGLGCVKSDCKLEVDPSVRPVVDPPRKVPFAIRNKVKSELDKMEKNEIIKKVDGPTDWVSSMVCVKKPSGKLRVCIDPFHLNKALKREYHPMKTVEEVASQLKGAKFFSVLDAEQAFYQVKLDDESSKLLTMNTPFGRYRFLRMPFGISPAPEIWQKTACEIFEGLEGVDVYMDDVLVWGETLSEHNMRLRRVLERADKQGLKLKRDKAKVALTEVNYVGHILSAEGLKVDRSKVDAIVSMPEPESVEDVKRFLGMVNYIAKFVPNLSSKTEPMRKLLEKDIAWHWHEQQQESFALVKEAICEATCLQYYDPDKPVVLSVDACSTGLGACLRQDDRPVAYGSRTLNKPERNYAQIEKEMLAIAFGCTRFHQYLYGREKVHVETDHKPLEFLFKKPIVEAPPRIQRMMLKVQRYDLDVHYRAGKELLVADTLSRATTLPPDDTEDQFEVFLMEDLPISSSRLDDIKMATKEDRTLQIVAEYIQNGWPKDRSQVRPEAAPFWQQRHQLTMCNALMMRGSRIVVPASRQKFMLDQVHVGHQGQERCKRRAREVMFWPGMSNHIENMVEDCEPCTRYQNRNIREPMICHEIPEHPWMKVGTDLFHLKGEHYLIVVDYFSKYFEVCHLRDLMSETTVNKMKSIFSRHGIPETVISDNGPQYASEEFRAFAESWGFKHITSSPKYPQANGLAERTVQTVKKTLKKTLRRKEDPYLALLALRDTPGDNIGSPAQLLFHRRLRTTLPKPPTPPTEHAEDLETHAKLKARQKLQKKYYDRGTKTQETLQENQACHFRSEDEEGKEIWKPAKVVRKVEQPRSYIIEAGGHKYRRNRNHILPSAIPEATSESVRPEPGPEPEATDTLNAGPEHQPPGPEKPLEPDPVPTASPYRTQSGRRVVLPARYRDG